MKFIRSLFIFMWIIKALESLVPYAHVDALNYHMVVGKYLSLGLFNDLWETVPGALMSGLFDLIYTIPNFIFGYGLIAHSSSQFLHFFFSIGLGSLLLYNYFLKKQQPLIGGIAGLLILTISKGASFLMYAKNDGVLAFALLATALYFYEFFLKCKLFNFKTALVFGVLLGINPAIKMNGVLYMTPFALSYTFLARHQIKFVFIAALTAMALWAPFLSRNYYYIGNPIFPGMISLIKGSASLGMIEYYSHCMSARVTPATFVINLKNLFLGKIVFLTTFFFVLKNKWKSDENILFYLIFAGFLIAMAVNGGMTAIRFLFPLMFLLVLYIALSAKSFKNEISQKPILALIIILILVDSKLDKSIRRIVDFSKDVIALHNEKLIVNKRIANTRLWNEIDQKKGTIWLLTDELSQQYYAPENLRLIQYQHNKNAQFMTGPKDQCAAKIIKFDYVLLKNPRDLSCLDFLDKTYKKEDFMDYALYKKLK